jgi:uncharacterized membrane protein YkoI
MKRQAMSGVAVALTLATSLGVSMADEVKKSVETRKVETKTVETRKDAAAEQVAMQKEAKITMVRARGRALAKVPGTILSSELEREHGKLIYSFDIKTKKPGVTEVNVDAITGKIIAVSQETPKKEAAEKKQEAKEKSSTRH